MEDRVVGFGFKQVARLFFAKKGWPTFDVAIRANGGQKKQIALNPATDNGAAALHRQNFGDLGLGTLFRPLNRNEPKQTHAEEQRSDSRVANQISPKMGGLRYGVF